MKTLLPLIFSMALATPALAQDDSDQGASVTVDLADSPRGFGIGVVLGEPTGLTFAVRPNSWNAVQGHLSYSLISDRARANVDYLQSVAVIQPSSARMEFPVYIGIGGTVGVTDDGPGPFGDNATAWVGGRVPFGITMLPDDVPVEVFAEIAPTVYVLPETTPGLEGGLGVRAYF